MSLIKFALPLTLALAAGPALAQQATAPLQTDGRWRGSINAGASFAAGNTDATTFNIGADAGRATEVDRIALGLTGLYGTRKDTGVRSESANLLRANGKYSHDISGMTFGFGSLNLEHDRLQELDLRSVLAAGLGRHIIKNDSNVFDVYTGPTYTYERYSADTRNSFEWLLGEESTHKISDTTSLNQRLAFYPNISNAGDYRIEFDAGVTTSITKKIELKLTLSNRYTSNPPPTIKKSDTLLLASVGYRFGAD